MTVAIETMVWDPDVVGWRDDSFATGWAATAVDLTKTDGDLAEIVVQGGETVGYIQKTISPGLDASTYKYLVVGLWGNGNYFIQVNDGAWKDAIAVVDAPDTYDIVTIDLTAVTAGTITAIRLGVGSVPAKKATYDFIEFHSADPEEPTAIVSLNVLQREGEADTFESRWVEGVSDPFTKGYNIRIIATRDANVEKIFAGVIEESNLLEGGNLRDVSGRCFQVKLQTATKNVTFSEDELSDAAKELVEDLTEVTTDRVETPAPDIKLRKKYTSVHIGDALDQLTSLPSKQAPFDAWRWKLGYGQDLRLRSVLDANVKVCTTGIVEGTNILSGVKLGSDLYGLYNKVVAYSGVVYLPYTDDYTEDFNDWAIENCVGCAGQFLQNGAPAEGTNSIQFVCDTMTQVRIKSDLGSAIDTTQMTRLILQVQAMTTFPYNKLTIYFGQNYDNSYYKEFTILAETGLWNEIALDLNGWSTRGAPTRTNVDYLAIECILPDVYVGSIWWDGLHFVAPKIEAIATDGASPVDHDRVYFYKDAKINNQDKLQDFADGLLETLKAAANRIQLPVTGAPDLQRGRKVTATSATFGLAGDYIIAEAEHVFNRDVGYTTTVLLDVERYSLPSELKRTIEQELRIERRDTLPDSLAEAGSAPHSEELTGMIDLDRIPSPIIGKNIEILNDGYIQFGEDADSPRLYSGSNYGDPWELFLQPKGGNSMGELGIMPSGTEVRSLVSMWNSPDYNNGGFFQIGINDDMAFLTTGQYGTGTEPTKLVSYLHLCANIFQDLGDATHKWRDLYLFGTIKAIGSTTLVTNLNADLWDSQHWGDAYPDAGYPNALLKDASRDIEGDLKPDGNATRDFGSSARHFLNVWTNTVKSSGMAIGIGTITEHILSLFTNNIARWNLSTGGDLLPVAINTYDIGSAVFTVKDIYAVNLHGTIGAWGDISGLFPRTIADLLSDHNLANHPLAIIPTMDDGHIPNLEGLSYGGAFAVDQIPTLTTAKLSDIPAAAWATIFSANFSIATVLSDHDLTRHPLAIIPTMDNAHIPVLTDAKYPNALLKSGARDIAGIQKPDGNATRDFGSTARHFLNIFARAIKSSGANTGIGTVTEHSCIFFTNDISRWYITSTGILYPSTHNTYDIGASGVRIKDLYAVTLHGALTAAEITSGQFSLSRMPRGTDGHVLTGTGAGSNPAYEAPAGALEIKRGSNTTDGSGNRTVTFGAAFAATPKVFLQGVDAGAKGIVLDVVSKSTTNFVVKSRKVTGITSGAGSSHNHSFSDSFNTSYVSAGTPAGTIGGPSATTSGFQRNHTYTLRYLHDTLPNCLASTGCAAIYIWTDSTAASVPSTTHIHTFTGSAMGTHRHSGTASGNTGYESAHTHPVDAPVLAIDFDWLAIEA